MRNRVELVLCGLIGGAVGGLLAWQLRAASAPGAEPPHQAADLMGLRREVESLRQSVARPELLGSGQVPGERLDRLERQFAELERRLVDGKQDPVKAAVEAPSDAHRRALLDEIHRLAEASPRGKDPGFGARAEAAEKYVRMYPSDSESGPLLVDVFNEYMGIGASEQGARLMREHGARLDFPEWQVSKYLLQAASVAGVPSEMRVAAQSVSRSTLAPDWARAEAMLSEATAWIIEKQHPYARHVYERIVSSFAENKAHNLAMIVDTAKGKIKSYEEAGVKSAAPPP